MAALRGQCGRVSCSVRGSLKTILTMCGVVVLAAAVAWGQARPPIPLRPVRPTTPAQPTTQGQPLVPRRPLQPIEIPQLTPPTLPSDTGPAATAPAATGPAATAPANPETSLAPVLNLPPDGKFVPKVFHSPPLTAATVTDADVQLAIRKGSDFLLRKLAELEAASLGGPSLEDHTKKLTELRQTWSNGGATMLALYALLATGHASDDPRLRFNSPELARHIQWMVNCRAAYTGASLTYTTALQACALAQLPERPEYRKELKRVRDELLAMTMSTGGYTYGRPDKDSGADNSNAQYGLLGVWTAADAGLEVPVEYWSRTDAYWRRQQFPEGGWSYWPDQRVIKSAYPAMIAAGVASLLVTREYMDLEVRMEPRLDRALDLGLTALAKMHELDSSDPYYLFGLERVGLAGGMKYLDNVNWYRHSAANLINWQAPDGSWPLVGKTPWGPIGYGRIVSSAYALLFLARGTNPVAITKLEYSGPWNARPRDAANLTQWMGKRFERPISWQSAHIDAETDDFIDAPILLITGSTSLQFNPAQVDKLRQFVQAGGTIFSSADGDKPEFTAAVRRIAGEIGRGMYEMRDLPRDHAVFSLYVPVANPPRLMGASNGVREYWIHSPKDLGAAWQGRRFSELDKFQIPANLLFYATGKGALRRRLETLSVPEPKVRAAREAAVLRYEYAGNWNPEPGAWRRMARLMRTEAATEVKVILGGVNKPEPAKVTLVHITGTAAFKLTAAQRDALRRYIEGGGTLLADAAGGAGALTKSMGDLLAEMFPEGGEAGGGLQTIPRDDPIYSGRLADSVPTREVEYRKFWQIQQGGPSTLPRLMGIKRGERWAVILSPEDLTSGYLGTHTWGIAGYTPQSAQNLTRNILLYALAGGVVPATTQPATHAPGAEGGGGASIPTTRPADGPR